MKILCSLLLAFLLLACNEDSSCDGDCVDGDMELDATERVDEEIAEAVSCQEHSECKNMEYCDKQDKICIRCPKPDMPLERQNWCDNNSRNVVYDQGTGRSAPGCDPVFPSLIESTYICSENERCYTIYFSSGEIYNALYDGPWAECRAYESVDYSAGTPEAWSDSGAFPLTQNDQQIGCQEKSDCFGTDTTQEFYMFSCSDSLCYGCVDLPNCDEECSDAATAQSCQWGQDEFGCPVVRRVTFNCQQGESCQEQYIEGFDFDEARCVSAE